MKAFISSTSEDLAEYRTAARDVCARLSLIPVGMEDFESMGVGATAGSQSKVKESNVYVGIIANRYGYIEAGQEKSVTELEFDYAGQLGLDRLCFLADPAAKLPSFPGEDQGKLAAFKARINHLIRSTFKDPSEFRYKLYDSLLKWLFRQRRGTVLERYVFEPLFADYARFGGREHDIARIEAFLDSANASYLVVSAPAGYGKTALAVKTIDQYRDDCAYHFFTTRYASGSLREMLGEQGFLRNTVQQLRLWDVPALDSWQSPTTLSGWVAAYHALVKRDLRERHLLVVDGLDEVGGFSLKPYFNVAPGTNLKIITTVRDVGQDLADEYGFPAGRTSYLALSGFSASDVAAALRLAGKKAGAFADQSSLLAKVITVTTPQGTVAGADPLYVTFLADAIERGNVTAANVGRQPRRLEDYLADWWKATVAEAGTKEALDLLGTLAAALGPIGRDDLIALHEELRGSWTDDPIRRLVTSMRRVVAGSDQDGYAFAHPRFRDYVRKFPEVAPFDAKLLAYCEGWRGQPRRYALTYAVKHLAQAGKLDRLFETVLDEEFQGEQRAVLGTIRHTLTDLTIAIGAGCAHDRFLDVLRAAASYRRLVGAEGVAGAIFSCAREGRFDAAAAAAETYGLGAKTSSAWMLALRAYLIWAAVRSGRRDAAVAMIAASGRQLGLRVHGSLLHVTDLCEALIASAIAIDPSLAAEISVDAPWAAQVLARLKAVPAVGDVQALLDNVTRRTETLEAQTGEHPSPEYAVEYLSEERAGDYFAQLRDGLITLAGASRGRELIDRALAAVERNPYPRYRDIGLVALGVSALAAPDSEWTTVRLEQILETGLEKEGVTFTFDLAAQLVAEARRRSMAAPALFEYLQRGESSSDRWGSRLRCLSARAAADATQDDRPSAIARLESAGRADGGFAGYMSAHLLSLASRWCELGVPARVAELGIIARSRWHAGRVRDPRFAHERQDLVARYEQWFADPPPGWPEAASTLRLTADADARRAYKDLAAARWLAAGKATGWGELISASLNDATALDLVLARFASRAIRRHNRGERGLTDAALAEAMTICGERFATSRPWDAGTPAVS
ncbi:MAG TPA: DUF4062 domain-containing protein [Vicinamibacterales bacterium]|nr:DUF4062 domain-containing protein [Vicinamibacterales bacterium]